MDSYQFTYAVITALVALGIHWVTRKNRKRNASSDWEVSFHLRKSARSKDDQSWSG
jgi:hypothetical protein